jgi:hypothetical protein
LTSATRASEVPVTRRDRDQHEHQAPVHDDHRDERTDEREHRTDELRRRVHALDHEVYIVREARHQLAAAPAIEYLQRQALNPAEQLDAHARDDLLADRGDRVRPGVGSGVLDQVEDREERKGLEEQMNALPLHGRDEVLGDLEIRNRRGRAERRAQQAEEHLPDVRTRVGEQSFVDQRLRPVCLKSPENPPLSPLAEPL